MASISQVDIHQVKDWLEEGSANIIDIRDPASFSMGHIPSAIPVGDQNVEECIGILDKDKTLVVCCYHGISSQDAAGFFMAKGFSNVHNMIGGYEAWRHGYPSKT